MMIDRDFLDFRNILVLLYLSILLEGLATELEQTFRPEALINATVFIELGMGCLVFPYLNLHLGTYRI